MKAKNLTLSAMFFALGIILPFLTGHAPQIGSMLLPMHLPIFLCAFICSKRYSIPVAFILPIFRSVIFGKPNMYPEAIAIAFELATYALVIGLMPNKTLKSIYISLITAMVSGRIVRGIVQLSLLKFIGIDFTFNAFFTGVILTSIPGIIIQLIIIPLVKTTVLAGDLDS